MEMILLRPNTRRIRIKGGLSSPSASSGRQADAAAARRGRTRLPSHRDRPSVRSRKIAQNGRRLCRVVDTLPDIFAALGHGTSAGIWVLFQVFL